MVRAIMHGCNGAMGQVISGIAAKERRQIQGYFRRRPYFIADDTKDEEISQSLRVGIQAIRGGTIVGEHDVIFAGQDEVITFNHTAYSKAIFAKGAVQAAKFLAGKPEGRYDMADVIG